MAGTLASVIAVVTSSVLILALCAFVQWRRCLPLAAGLLILFDAALVEPVAVSAGLWSWSESAVLGVPLIGIAGWGALPLDVALPRAAAAVLFFALAALGGDPRLWGYAAVFPLPWLWVVAPSRRRPAAAEAA